MNVLPSGQDSCCCAQPQPRLCKHTPRAGHHLIPLFPPSLETSLGQLWICETCQGSELQALLELGSQGRVGEEGHGITSSSTEQLQQHGRGCNLTQNRSKTLSQRNSKLRILDNIS